ncbi:MAG: methyltransferase domain-containing protein [Acidimicrobiales bacterium]
MATEHPTSEPLSDRDRWNARYRDGDVGGTPIMLGRDLHQFPRQGRGVDVAGGAGEAAAILAARGMDMTVIDVSDVALARAAERAATARVELTLLELDLTVAPFPPGPWDLITCFNYLDRALFPVWIDSLAPGGMLAVTLATRRNLERHDRPSEPFLLDDGELPSLLGGLELVRIHEGWDLNGRHTASAIARRV